MHLGVLIPVYNEAGLLERSIERLRATPPPVDHLGEPLRRTAFLVDDGSTDGTRKLVEQATGSGDESLVVRPILHQSNRGKGAAIRTALAQGLQAGCDAFILHDADLEYDPADHARVLAPILDGRADAVIGSRFLGDTHRVLYYWHAVANRGITLASNVLTNLNLTDIECCLKAFTRPVAQQLRLQEDRFGIEPELVAKIARSRLPAAGGVAPARVYEVGVSYAGRTYAEGKKIRWTDGFSALRCIVYYNLLTS
ncbi:MAG: glycosyltransferase family 2 protein [bacterium]|jgi:glycosyltransferase involved in cell wall biosynthesis